MKNYLTIHIGQTTKRKTTNNLAPSLRVQRGNPINDVLIAPIQKLVSANLCASSVSLCGIAISQSCAEEHRPARPNGIIRVGPSVQAGFHREFTNLLKFCNQQVLVCWQAPPQ